MWYALNQINYIIWCRSNELLLLKTTLDYVLVKLADHPQNDGNYFANGANTVKGHCSNSVNHFRKKKRWCFLHTHSSLLASHFSLYHFIFTWSSFSTQPSAACLSDGFVRLPRACLAKTCPLGRAWYANFLFGGLKDWELVASRVIMKRDKRLFIYLLCQRTQGLSDL